MEVFSPPRVAPEVERRGAPLGERPSCDRLLGWDSSNPKHVQDLWGQIEREEPETIWLCPECKVFSAINRLSKDCRDPGEWHQALMEGLRDLIICMEVAKHQHDRGRYFAFEHPLYASSRGAQVVSLIASLPGVRRPRVDMCVFGLQ
eukprot:8462170-Pyramimonas_sp.AAC.1